MTSSLQTNWIARFFILIYLLLITSTGNAFFWCQDLESSVHLESNLSGTCWNPCAPGEKERQHRDKSSNTSEAFSLDMGDCIDSPVHSSAITPANQHRTKNKSALTDINTTNPSWLQTKSFRAESPGSLYLAQRLPPRQALTALRTIVLLH